MNVLVITNLFPNSIEPQRGIFNKQQFLELAKLCNLRVIAPLPFLPSSNIKEEEIIGGIKTYHPRHCVIPKIGRILTGWFYYFAIRQLARRIQKEFNFDVILATWAYPDCYAASLLAKELNKPLVCKVHGSDINVGFESLWRQKFITKAFEQAKGIVSVSRPLKNKMTRVGISEAKIIIIPNGIDKTLFKHLDKNVCRQKLSLDNNKKFILFIGNLVPVKGLTFLIEAMKTLSTDIHLNIVGEGELKEELVQQVNTLGLAERVKFVGKVKHEEIPTWMNASDVFCLPSLNEGCPNVIVEAIGCNSSIVATKVGAIPELLASYSKSILVNPKDTQDLARGLNDIFVKQDDLSLMSVLSWEENAQRLYQILK